MDEDNLAFSIRGNHNEDINGDNNEFYEVIRREELKPLNDPNCKHENIILDPDGDEIGDTRAWVCTDCRRGVFLPKHITKIT